MSSERGFHVELTIEAPLDVVWHALTDPAEIRRWFGWDYSGLDEEIRYIFVEHSTLIPPDRITGEDGSTIELSADGPRTIVRVVRPGPLADAHWDDIYDEVVQGWHQFLTQLRFYLERHIRTDRRTLFLEGTAVPRQVVAAIDETDSAQTWYSGRHQRVSAVDEHGGSLVVVVASAGLESDQANQMHVTVTTHGLNDEQFDAANRVWHARWTALAEDARITP